MKFSTNLQFSYPVVSYNLLSEFQANDIFITIVGIEETCVRILQLTSLAQEFEVKMSFGGLMKYE